MTGISPAIKGKRRRTCPCIFIVTKIGELAIIEKVRIPDKTGVSLPKILQGNYSPQ